MGAAGFLMIGGLTLAPMVLGALLKNQTLLRSITRDEYGSMTISTSVSVPLLETGKKNFGLVRTDWLLMNKTDCGHCQIEACQCAKKDHALRIILITLD